MSWFRALLTRFNVTVRLIHGFGRTLRKIGNELLKCGGIKGIWIDVGAHHGETTLSQARQNPGLQVYAFEPNLCAFAKLVGVAPNYMVFPMAVAEDDGVANLYLNTHEAASSLLPLSDRGKGSWIGGEELVVERVVPVPTLRLDTFMNLMNIGKVDFLKIDSQGMDLSVLRSAGERLSDIQRVTLEVAVTSEPLYLGAGSKDETLSLMKEKGFVLEDVEKQSYDQEENLTFVRRVNGAV